MLGFAWTDSFFIAAGRAVAGPWIWLLAALSLETLATTACIAARIHGVK
jgi:hypothetical protein